jgi:hypothetical protein
VGIAPGASSERLLAALTLAAIATWGAERAEALTPGLTTTGEAMRLVLAEPLDLLSDAAPPELGPRAAGPPDVG